MFTKTLNYRIFLLVFFTFMVSLQADEDEEFYKQKWLKSEEAYARYSGPLRILIGSFIERMERELQLECTGEGGSCGQTVDLIKIKFDVQRRATFEEARAIELYLIDEFIKVINSNQEIRPYLIEYPISHKYVTVSLSFRGPLGRSADGIDFMFNVPQDAVPENQNTIVYYAFDPFNDDSHEVHVEKYEEAVRLDKASNLKYPFAHQSSERELALDESLIPFTEKLRMDQRFECWGIGCPDALIKDIGAKFVAIQRVTQQDARKLALYVADNLIEHLNRSDRLKPFLAETPFPTHRLKFRIDFVNKNYCPFTDGSIESIVVANNEFSYFYLVKEPDDLIEEEWWISKTTLLAKESYDEAKRRSTERPPSIIRTLYEKAKSIYSR